MSDTTVTIRVLYKDLEVAKEAANQLRSTLLNLQNERYELHVLSAQQDQQLKAFRNKLSELTTEAERLKRSLELAPNSRTLQLQYTAIAEEIKIVSDAQKEYTKSITNTSDALKQNALDAEKASNQRKRILYLEAETKRRLEEEERKQTEAEAQREEARLKRVQEYNTELEATVAILKTIASVSNAIGTVFGATNQFANSIGDAFSSMGGLFSTDISRYIATSLTHQLMQSLVGETSKVVSRYDILNTFIPYMGIMGVDAATAAEAQSQIDLSIRGLPIGLDEATQRFRRYLMFLNDVDAAKNLTIGLQNLLVAGGAGESYQNQSYTLIERMLATGTLRDIRQWQSLLVGLGVSQRFIEEEMGFEPGGLLRAIQSKELDVNTFLGAIERLGAGTTDVAQKVASALQIYRSTIQSWLENIEFAVTRGNVTILNAFNDTLEKITGSGITDYLEKWRDTENTIFGRTAQYIEQHPEQLESVINDASRLIDAIGSLSASTFIESTVNNLSTLVDIFTVFLDNLPEDFSLEEFASFAMTIAGPIGSIFSAVSSGAPAMIAIFERFNEFDWNMFAKDLASAVDSLSKLFLTILNKIDDPTMSKLLTFGLVYGSLGKTVFGGIGNVVGGIGNALLSRGMIAMALYNMLKGYGFTSAAPTFAATTSAGGATAAGGAGALGTLGILGAFLAGSGLMAYGAYRRDENKIKEIQDRLYPQTIGGYRSSITNIDNLLSERFDPETGYSTDSETQYLLYLREAYQRQYNEMLNHLPKEMRARYRNSVITRSLSGNANEFEWFETAGKYDYNYGIPTPMQIRSVEGAILSLRDAYDELYDEAKESLDGQVELFSDLEETIDKSYERLINEQAQYLEWQEKVRILMSYATTENNEVLQEIVESGVDGMERLDEAITKLKKNPDALDGLQRQLHSTENAMKDATSEAEDLIVMLQLLGDEAFTSGEMMGINLEYGIRSGASKAVLAAYEMAAAIRAAMGSISAAGWSQINATQYYDFESQPTAYWDSKRKIWVYRANGGPIYAEDGRFVPRGTDTVPAMLTPGEFVMRRAAVDTFGAKFMKYVNDLNIGAAFDSLVMSRDRLLHGNSVTYNNSRDNHATVNQNIITNSPGFTYKRAGRFVRGLA